jgi:hypothetical protein
VGALIRACLLDALLVAFAEHGLDFGGGQLVIARPWLPAAERGDATEDRGAVLVLALVGIDLREVDLGELGQLADDLLRGRVGGRRYLAPAGIAAQP